VSDPISIELKGADELIRALNEYPSIAEPDLRTATEQAYAGLVDPLATYPSQAPTNYVRSGNLGRAWSSAIPELVFQRSTFSGRLGNAMPYGPYVQGDEQAYMHVGRWQTVREIVRVREPNIQRAYEAAGERIAAAISRRAG